METIHELSALYAPPEFDIFGVPPTQLTVERDMQTEHRPITTITNSYSPIEFEIHSPLDEYINLRKTELYLCLQINLSKSSLAKDKVVTADDWKKICPINYLLNTFFKQINIEIGKTPIKTSSINYAYLAYMDALLNTTSEAKRTHLQTAFWHRDIAGKMDEINEERSIRIRPNGNSLEEGCELELYGNLHLDLGDQIRPLIGNVDVGLQFFPNDPKFYLMYEQTLEPEVKIKDIRLFVHRSKVSHQVVAAHNKFLMNPKFAARYFITRKEVKTFIIQKGTIDVSLDYVQNDFLPCKVYVGFVPNDAKNGDPRKNGFFFKNYLIGYMVSFMNGVPYPHRAYCPRFLKNKYMREYFGLYEALNQIKPITTTDISRKEFVEGFTIFGFNFVPDLSDGASKSGYTSPIKKGDLRLEIKFEHPLSETVSAVIFYEYDNCIQIPMTRIPYKDFM